MVRMAAWHGKRRSQRHAGGARHDADPTGAEFAVVPGGSASVLAHALGDFHRTDRCRNQLIQLLGDYGRRNSGAASS